MNLREQGFRFWVSPCRKQARWIHPAETPPGGWEDCTDLDDAAFYLFMLQK